MQNSREIFCRLLCLLLDDQRQSCSSKWMIFCISLLPQKLCSSLKHFSAFYLWNSTFCHCDYSVAKLFLVILLCSGQKWLKASFRRKMKERLDDYNLDALKIISQLSFISSRNFIKENSSAEHVMYCSKAGNYWCKITLQHLFPTANAVGLNVLPSIPLKSILVKTTLRMK